MHNSEARSMGDYQTPPDFSNLVCRYLKNVCNLHPDAVIEPTCGQGNFLRSALLLDAKEYIGIEINPQYCAQCRETIRDPRVRIIEQSIFGLATLPLLHTRGSVLILGNPPWVTNSYLSTTESPNLPQKENFKHLHGMDALTGASNFDICENIILQMAHEYVGHLAVLAMLCKTSVARNVFQEFHRERLPFRSYKILRFDAKKVFSVHVDVCLLLMDLNESSALQDVCEVASLDDSLKPSSYFGYRSGRFYSNLTGEADDFEGASCFSWRQGIKHDCASVMELCRSETGYKNRMQERVDIEETSVFPLVKSSMLKEPILHDFQKYVIVTQKKIREDTRLLQKTAPKTWRYLTDHRTALDRRKSIVYQGTPPFSTFGVGLYSFAPYKVGISGFYKQPIFSLLHNTDGKPVMLDDTCYYLSFPTYAPAYVAMLMLNNVRVQNFWKSIAFLDAKRPFTKKVLCRFDFLKACRSIQLQELLETEKTFSLPRKLTQEMYQDFQDLVFRISVH